ncbi:TetR family transcriptional regulator [Mycobacteroides salmoniphilum]|uniref:TetR family transcriptional regulator n=1 Tax=Mycobacteroides salmoniphilum TaxID=404941 RepID=UPI001065969D|nr:TetR family transcriptional regulator [Mycobacteroides salmoniphilum]
MAGSRRPGRPTGPPVDVERRREELLDAAERAIRTSGPQVGLGEVAKQAGFVRSVVYAIFPSRAALLTELSRRHAVQILLNVARSVPPEATDRQRLAAFIDSLCQWIETEPELYRALGAQAFVDDDAHGIFEELAESTETLLTVNLSTLDAKTEAAGPWSRAMIGAVAAATAWWRRTGAMSRTELVEHLTYMCWEGGARLPLFGDRNFAED